MNTRSTTPSESAHERMHGSTAHERVQGSRTHGRATAREHEHAETRTEVIR